MRNLSAIWYLWLFPLFAVLIAGWLFWDYIENRGPTITIYFQEGTRIKPNRTDIRFRGVQIGMVTDVAIAKDLKNIEVRATLDKSAKDFAKEGAKFWLESPRISFEEIRGLETLLEGSYIAALPGHDGIKKDFVGHVGSNLKNPLEDTAVYHLETKNLEAVSEGDPLFYRGLNVGSVTNVKLSKTAQAVLVQLRIPWEYAKLIRTNTVFWRKAGFQAKLGLFKSEIKLTSLDTLLHGGVEFATPEPAGEKAKSSTVFVLEPSAPKEWEKWSPKL